MSTNARDAVMASLMLEKRPIREIAAMFGVSVGAVDCYWPRGVPTIVDHLRPEHLAAFVDRTSDLSVRQLGALAKIVQYIDENGAVPGSTRRWSRECGVSRVRWLALRDQLVRAGKIVPKGPFLVLAPVILEVFAS